MAGLRIRWRRDSAALPAGAPLVRDSDANVSRTVLLYLTLALIVALALAARLYAVNWDENSHLHPDERFITIIANDIDLPSSIPQYFDSSSSPLNPFNKNAGGFAYGTLPLFMTKLTGVALGMDNYDQLVLVGRHITAVFDAATVLLVFLLARRLYGPLAGLLGAVLYASAPLAIQHAHFLVVDPYLTFFTTATLYFCVRIVQEGRWYDYAFAGLTIGLGMACKLTGLALVPVLVLAVAMRVLATRPFAFDAAFFKSDELQRPLSWLFVAVLVGFLAFRVTQPYAFEAPSPWNLVAPWTIHLDDRFTAEQKEQSQLLGGNAGFPPSVQWIGRTSYIYPLKEMLRFGMGPAFGVAGWLAVLYAGYRAVRFRETRHVLLLAFVLLYFGFMGRQFSLYLRYFLPLYPVLAVLAGFMLADLMRAAESAAERWRRPALSAVGGAAVAIVTLLALLGGVAYMHIYSQPVTRIEASRWLFDRVPSGKSFAVETWDDSLPMQLPGSPSKRFEYVQLELYEPDTPAKVDKLIADLDKSDYVVLSSNRLLQSIPRNRVAYPVSSLYYELLFNEELGFRLLRTFTSYPQILGIEYPDDMAEESWSSYDHPPVWVFEKTPAYSHDAVKSALSAAPYAIGGATPAVADKSGLLLSATDLQTQRAGGTWTDTFASSGLSVTAPTLVWLFVLEVAALAVMPIAFVVLRRLPDRGYLLSKPLGLLLLGYPVWLAVSLKLVHFERTTVLLWLLVLLAGGAFVAWRNRIDLLDFVRREWKLILFSELLFLVAFFLFREIRVINPDLWHPYRGGEKPMDLAYFTAITRSSTLPPYDPWFAGGYINYYYLGQYFAAVLTKATAIVPSTAYNLAVPTFFAMAVGGGFSVAYNLAAATRSLMRRGPGFRPIPRWSLYVTGVAAGIFIAVAGNLDGLDQLADRLSAVSPWEVDLPVPIVPAVINSVGGLWQVVFHGAALEPFDFWRSSRMLPSPSTSITEFPYFSFLYADLHAHMIAIPFQLLAVGLCLSLVMASRGEKRDWREWAIVALLGLLVGTLRGVNSWDYPTFLLLSAAAIVISERRIERGWLDAGLRVLAKTALLVGLSMLLLKPFTDNYLAPVAGTHPSPETTPLHSYYAHFGFFVAIGGVWLLYQLYRALGASPLRFFNDDARLEKRERLLWLGGLCVAILLVTVVVAYAAVSGHSLVGTLAPALAVVLYLSIRELRLRRPDGGVRLFVYTMAFLALGLSIGVEFVTLDGDIERMNTIFKFYLHAWLLFALVAAYGAWYLVFVAWRPAPVRARSPLRRTSIALGKTALVALFLSVLLYPLLATGPRLDDRFTDLPNTLDGEAYMQTAVYDDQKGKMVLDYDYQGIEWLRANVQGSPTIVEGRADLYRWGARFSIYTGLPAVVGWDWHQRQQRGDLGFMVDARNRDVDQFYGASDSVFAQRFLQKYNVRYVIVGQLEKLYYSPEGIAKFATGLGGSIRPVYENPQLTIYEVDQQALARVLP